MEKAPIAAHPSSLHFSSDAVVVLVAQGQKSFQMAQLWQNEGVPWRTEVAGAAVTAAHHLSLDLAPSWEIA